MAEKPVLSPEQISNWRKQQMFKNMGLSGAAMMAAGQGGVTPEFRARGIERAMTPWANQPGLEEEMSLQNSAIGNKMNIAKLAAAEQSARNQKTLSQYMMGTPQQPVNRPGVTSPGASQGTAAGGGPMAGLNTNQQMAIRGELMKGTAAGNASALRLIQQFQKENAPTNAQTTERIRINQFRENIINEFAKEGKEGQSPRDWLSKKIGREALTKDKTFAQLLQFANKPGVGESKEEFKAWNRRFTQKKLPGNQDYTPPPGSSPQVAPPVAPPQVRPNIPPPNMVVPGNPIPPQRPQPAPSYNPQPPIGPGNAAPVGAVPPGTPIPAAQGYQQSPPGSYGMEMPGRNLFSQGPSEDMTPTSPNPVRPPGAAAAPYAPPPVVRPAVTDPHGGNLRQAPIATAAQQAKMPPVPANLQALHAQGLLAWSPSKKAWFDMTTGEKAQ